MEKKMEHENEILGTVLSVMFAGVAGVMVKYLWATAPMWAAIAGTAVLGGVAAWALLKVAEYWVRKIVDRKSGK
jgi:hypothetical protein